VDSVQIGKVVLVSLCVSHPSTQELLFPDTANSFGYFNCAKKEWFPTKTIGLISIDSAVYSLKTFQPQSSYQLSMPVWLLNEGDSIQILSNTISLKFHSALSGPIKGLQEDAEYQFVNERLDYPRIILWLMLLIIISGLGYGIFGKRIISIVRQLLLFRRQRIFLILFDRLVDQSLREINPTRVEELLLLWKRHLQRLTEVNYSTFTTRDFSKVLANDGLIAILRRIDKIVYAGDTEEIRKDLFIPLRELAQDFYLKRREALRYGN